MKTILITGGNRGIGLELVKQFLSDGSYHIYATCRNRDNAHDLNALADKSNGVLKVLPLDVSNPASIAALEALLEGQTLDVLVNNAGVYLDKGKGLLDADFSSWMKSFEINSVSPFRIVKALYSNLAQSEAAKILTISSQMGAMSRPSSGSYAYCASKAAVNKGMIGLAVDLKPRGIAVAVAHPGWVQTDMGGAAADITPTESAKGLYNVIENLSIDTTGSFFKWNGEIHEW